MKIDGLSHGGFAHNGFPPLVAFGRAELNCPRVGDRLGRLLAEFWDLPRRKGWRDEITIGLNILKFSLDGWQQIGGPSALSCLKSWREQISLNPRVQSLAAELDISRPPDRI